MSNLNSRNEFREILSSVIQCARGNLDKPGISPFTPEEVFAWFQQITIDDVRAVFEGLERNDAA
jgi:hypothetical protein